MKNGQTPVFCDFSVDLRVSGAVGLRAGIELSWSRSIEAAVMTAYKATGTNKTK